MFGIIFYKDSNFQQSKGCSNFVFQSDLISQFEENISFDFLANVLQGYRQYGIILQKLFLVGFLKIAVLKNFEIFWWCCNLNISRFSKNFQSIWFRLKNSIKRSENKSADSIVCTKNTASECSENQVNTFLRKVY